MRTVRSRVKSCFVVLLAAASLLATNADRLGLLLPPDEAQGASLRRGVQFGVEEANRSTNRPLQLIVRGRPGQWGDDGTEAARMGLDDSVRALIAPPGGAASHLTLQVAGRTAIPVVSLCADSSIIGAGIPWMLQLVPGTTETARALLTSLRQTHHLQHWGAIVPEDRSGREILRDLREAATNAGCQLDPVLAVGTRATNATELGRQLPPAGPDGFLIWLDPESAGRVVHSLRTAGFTGTLAGPGRLDSPVFLEAAGKAAEHFVVASPALDSDSRSRREAFDQRFRERFGQPADETAAFGYDAARLLARLIRQAEGRELHALFPLSGAVGAGVTGPWTFDPQGRRQLQLELRAYRDGHWSLARAP